MSRLGRNRPSLFRLGGWAVCLLPKQPAVCQLETLDMAGVLSFLGVRLSSGSNKLGVGLGLV